MPRVCLTAEQRADFREQAFGDWLDGEIRRRELDTAEVARWLGVSPQALRSKIRGEAKWKLWDFILITDKMRLEPEKVIQLTGGYNR